MTPEYAKKVDANHAEIRKFIRDKLHYCWIDTFRTGFGFPDAVVIAHNGIPVMFEIKPPGEGPNKNEMEFREKIEAAGYHHYYVVKTPEDALAALAFTEEFRIEAV